MMSNLCRFFNPLWWRFEWMYWRRRTPWDTNITPPEVMEFLSRARPGRALDLGCGTGTNAITLSRHGWQVTGIDISDKAIRTARRKADRAGYKIDFRVGDVSDFAGVEGPYDYALDIGCLLILDPAARKRYAAGLARVVRSQGCYMLYAWLPKNWRGQKAGLSPEEVGHLFADYFELTRKIVGEEKGHPSAWYWLQKT